MDSVTLDWLTFLIRSLFLGFPCAYLVGAFLLKRKSSHEGPFATPLKVVYFEAEQWGDDQLPAHTQRVALFDWIRRFFGVYRVEGRVWKVRDDWRSEVWTCPFCLSFWMAFLFSLPIVWLYRLPWWMILLVHPGIAAVSVLIHGLIWRDSE